MSKQMPYISHVLWDASPVSAVASSPVSSPNPGLTLSTSSAHAPSSSHCLTPEPCQSCNIPSKRPLQDSVDPPSKKQIFHQLITPLSKSRCILQQVASSAESPAQSLLQASHSVSQIWSTTQQVFSRGAGMESSSLPSSPQSPVASPPSSPAHSLLDSNADSVPGVPLHELVVISDDSDSAEAVSVMQANSDEEQGMETLGFEDKAESLCSSWGFFGDQSQLGDTDEEIDVVGCSDDQSQAELSKTQGWIIPQPTPVSQPPAPCKFDPDVLVIESSSEDQESVHGPDSSMDKSKQSSLEVLYNCLDDWSQKCNWTELVENNPLHDADTHPLMAEHVMDFVTAYLTHCNTARTNRGTGKICLVPAASSGALLATMQNNDTWLSKVTSTGGPELLSLRELVWLDLEPPALVLLPYINHLQVHSYLAFGRVTQAVTGIYNIHLHLLDSLSQPSRREIESRLEMFTSILRCLVPQINGQITGSYMGIPQFRQAPGSTDCGWFVCQAVSAIAHGQEEALNHPLSIQTVKQRVQNILLQCRDGALHQVCMGHNLPSVTLLHTQFRPPPWKVPTRDLYKAKRPEHKPWIAPKYERSLSEPLGDSTREDPGEGSWQDIFGPHPDVAFQEVSGEAFGGYLDAVSQGKYTPPPGLLADVGARLPGSLMEALLLNGEHDALPWAPDALSDIGSDDGGLEDAAGGVGLPRFLRGLQSIPEGRERSHAILTGERLNQTLSLNWTKDQVELQEQWLTAGLDVDSLSLTAEHPQFTSSVVFHMYPPRSSTLTTDNGLSVNVNGEVLKLSHIPNFTFAHTGSHNQFRINIFFPAYKKGLNAGKRYVTMLNDEDSSLWCNSVLLPALHRVELLCPPQYRHAATTLRQSVPKSYEQSKPRGSINSDSFKGFRMLPELFNLLVHYCRKIVNFFPRLAKFRSFFFHIFGMNLKAVGPETGRGNGNALLHILKQYPIVDWSLQNPRDIAVDIGLEINVLEEKLPNSTDGVTLLWRLSALEKLTPYAWRQAHVNSYVHSHVIGGISVAPRTLVRMMFYYMHAYMKDKVVTYEHRDYSHGAAFSPLDGLSRSQRYSNDIHQLRERLRRWLGSFGIRIEWRCGVWAANEILQMNPRLWIRRFLQCDAIVAVRTKHVVQLKVVLLDSYCWFFSQLQQLPASERASEPVLLLASVLTYLIHGLVKRPDEMSSSRFMAKSLNIVARARQFGLASVPARCLSSDLLGMSHTITYGSYKILNYTARKNPAGARLKTSRLLDTRRTSEGYDSPEDDNAESIIPACVIDDEELRAWVMQLVNNTMASWLWGRMSGGDKSQRAPRNSFCGPFLLDNWNQCVDHAVRYSVRPSATGYGKVVSSLFPLNWVMTDQGKVWDTMQTMVLEPIRQRLSSLNPQSRTECSQRIRVEISRVMKTWEYIPCIQKGRVWSYTGTGATKKYMLYRNPVFSTRR